MQISPHVSFDGKCEQAFLEYHRILGGTITTLMKYGESPMASQIDSKWHNRIVHAALRLGDFELAGADLLPHDYKQPQGFSVLLTVASPAKAKQVFLSLCEGGEVKLPFQETFWSSGFGVLVDRFHVPWEINCAKPPNDALQPAAREPQ
jgi:PhnB protein